MLRGNVARGGILFVSIAAAILSCGQRVPTEPDLPNQVVAASASEIYLGSPQLESRQLLIDGHATEIEWNIAGDPIFVLLHNSDGPGGQYLASVRSLWSYNPFGGDSVALYLLLQWPDRAVDQLERPLVTSLDWKDPDGNLLIDCETNDAILHEENWSRDDRIHEDQVEIELYSDATGAYPADLWRWGAHTTNFSVPVGLAEFPTADTTETSGSTLHPAAAFAEDFYNAGGGWVRDAGQLMYENNFLPGSNVPRFIAGKAVRDVRLNRGKPTAFVVWRYPGVAHQLSVCDSLNPARVDDPSIRDKTWNPGDYVPSYLVGLPTDSQADVLSRGGWENGKWSLEVRRLLEARAPETGSVSSHNPPWPDDVILRSGHTYGLRFRIYNASKTVSSVSQIIPLTIKPRS